MEKLMMVFLKAKLRMKISHVLNIFRKSIHCTYIYPIHSHSIKNVLFSFYQKVNWIEYFIKSKTATPGFSRSISTNSSVSSTAHLLGSTQTQEVRATWTIILGQLQKVGVQCIVDLFELHPFVKEHFRGILVKHSKVLISKFFI